MTIKGKRIVLCVTGGIAAYKACVLTSQLTKAGALVDVVMSRAAKQFVGVSTFQGLSRRAVYEDVFTEPHSDQIAHIDLADQADLIIVAPATANAIAKLANGIADDMMSTLILAAKAPVWVAPAMNVNMYDHPAVQANMKRIEAFNYHLLEPGEGLLACGWIGKGRMAEPEDIFDTATRFFTEKENKSKVLNGKAVLVTAGPTREELDPVRYLTNYSSGKMGYAIAEALMELGANVTLVSGPTSLRPPSGVQVINVTSTEEMYKTVIDLYNDMDAVIKSAAVADYRPKKISGQKIKKNSDEMAIEFVKNPDILKELGHLKKCQILIGFAAETEHLEKYAKQKLEKKNLDMIVGNNVSEADAGFDKDTNRVTFFYKDGKVQPLEVMPKKKVAENLAAALAELLEKRSPQ